MSNAGLVPSMQPGRLLPFLVHLMNLRDPHARRHSEHVSALSLALAQSLELTTEEQEIIRFAAAIHDIGKLAINDFLMNKPGRFTTPEYLMMQQHALLGADMLYKLDLDPRVVSMVLQHHENFDGSGYPGGNRGDAIPLGARIIRLADTYDALTSNRGYHVARPAAEAMAIMESVSECFDPELQEAFNRMRPGRNE
ncbi:MAG TPA: HD domain-containing phosphohydrolase [Anaerolineales bacterium]